MTLLRRILREPVFSGQTVLSRHLEGSQGCPLKLYGFDCITECPYKGGVCTAGFHCIRNKSNFTYTPRIGTFLGTSAEYPEYPLPPPPLPPPPSPLLPSTQKLG